MTDRLQQIDAHPALFLLRNCFAIPRLVFSLRSAPCYRQEASLQELDAVIRHSASLICNIDFDEIGWRQASLPIDAGGLGIRTTSDLAAPAFYSSVSACGPLVEGILQNITESPLTQLSADIEGEWLRDGFPVPQQPKKQRSWDRLKADREVVILKSTCDQHRLACITSASLPHSGAWLSALPSSAVGNLVDDDCLRFAAALRIGARVCSVHICRCGDQVDEFGLHTLSCKRSAGRFPRHCALNDVIRRALDTAGFHSILEPVGLDRGDGKRPDGMTIFPFSGGKSLVWDATCTDTFAPSSTQLSATDPGSAARAAELRKTTKYAALADRYIFQPVAVETSGSLGPSTRQFLEKLGHIMSLRTGGLQSPPFVETLDA